MTTSDTILFVKETKTCSYVLVINTPRLCGEPGFRSRRDVGEQATIRCREVVNSLQFHSAVPAVPDTDYPKNIPKSKTVLPPLAVKEATLGEGSHEKTIAQFLRTFQKILGGRGDTMDDQGQEVPKIQEVGVTEDGNVVFEILEDISMDDLQRMQEAGAGQGTGAAFEADRLAKALKAAGFDVAPEQFRPKLRTEGREDGGGGQQKKKSKGESKDDADPSKHIPAGREEL